MMGFGFIGIILVVVLIAVLAGWHPLGNQTSGSFSDGPGESSLEILKARYAKGEISKGEFDQIREDLK